MDPPQHSAVPRALAMGPIPEPAGYSVRLLRVAASQVACRADPRRAIGQPNRVHRSVAQSRRAETRKPPSEWCRDKPKRWGRFAKSQIRISLPDSAELFAFRHRHLAPNGSWQVSCASGIRPTVLPLLRARRIHSECARVGPLTAGPSAAPSGRQRDSPPLARAEPKRVVVRVEGQHRQVGGRGRERNHRHGCRSMWRTRVLR